MSGRRGVPAFTNPRILTNPLFIGIIVVVLTYEFLVSRSDN